MGNSSSSSLACFQPFAFPMPLNISTCDEGYYCPNLDPSDIFTYPQVCPPSVDCTLDRLASKYCAPQGIYEPITCPPGNYCPNSSLMVSCPEGSYCPRFSSQPLPCPVFSHCPAGTNMRLYYGGVVLVIIIDVAMAAIWVWLRYRGEPAAWKARREARRASREGSRADGGGDGARDGALGGGMEMSLLEKRAAGGGSSSSSSAGRKGTAGGAVVRALQQAADSLGLGLDVGALGGMQLPQQRQGAGGSSTGEVEAYRSLEDEDVAGSGGGRGGGGASAHNSSSSINGAPPSPSRASPAFVSGAALDALAAKRILESAFTRCNAGLRLDLQFTGMTFTLPAPDGRTILSGVSGRMRPGRVTAIMGPSGAGKTTFLNVLMGKLTRTAGQLHVNGHPDEVGRYKKILGYVPQDDVMIRELTVRENILFSARMRLPRHGWDDAAVQELVDAILDVLGLSFCADTLSCRVSGGQRKRTNIGMELAAAPAVLFLDEPTSGLDATAAFEVCNTLKAIADLGVTVVAVIHQPRVEIFTSFDELLLLAPGGLTVFAGPQPAVVGYFKDLGFGFQEGVNPADDMLDFVAGKGPGVEGFWDRLHGGGGGGGGGREMGDDDDSSPPSTPVKADGGRRTTTTAAPTAAISSVASLLAKRWVSHGADAIRLLRASSSRGGLSSSLISASSTNSLSSLILSAPGSSGAPMTPYAGSGDLGFGHPLSLQEGSGGSGGGGGGAGGNNDGGGATAEAFDPASLAADRGASFGRQLFLCHNRAVRQQYRAPGGYALEMGVSVLAGGVMGAAAMALPELYVGVLRPPYTLLSPSPQEALLPSLCLYVALAVGIAGTPAGVKTFGEEKDVFYREASSGHSRLAYYVAKSAAQIYRFTLAAVHFSAIFHLLALPATDFGTMLGLVWLQYFAVYGLAAVTSMVVARENASLLGVIIALIAGCLCGFGPSLNQGRSWGVGFLQDLSHARWATEAFFHTETLSYRSYYMVEEVSAPLFGYTLNRMAYDVAVVLAIGTSHRVAAYLLLTNIDRDKQR